MIYVDIYDLCWFSPIYSSQYLACTHPNSVIGDLNIVLSSNDLFVQIVFEILPSFVRLACPSQRSLPWRSIVNIVGSPRTYKTSLFDVLLFQNIKIYSRPSSFHSERMWKTFNIFLEHHMLSIICFCIKLY